MPQEALFVSHKIQVLKSEIHGYGVFAKEPIAPNELIEECRFFDIPMENYRRIEFIAPDFASNFHCWPKAGRDRAALVLGFGSIYNHGDRPNAEMSTDELRRLYVFSATAPIQTDCEILVSYGTFWWMTRKHIDKK